MTPTTRTIRSRDLRRNSTPAEQRLWGYFRGRALDGWKFRRQQPLGPYTADFYCAQAKLVIEVDGGGHALTIERDDQRSKYFTETGILVLRFWNSDIMRNAEGVSERILENLGTPSPQSSPARGEEGNRASGTSVKKTLGGPNHGC